nr:MAG TPA: hypothetical protein [Caudoviricetes sp.]
MLKSLLKVHTPTRGGYSHSEPRPVSGLNFQKF